MDLQTHTPADRRSPRNQHQEEHSHQPAAGSNRRYRSRSTRLETTPQNICSIAVCAQAIRNRLVAIPAPRRRTNLLWHKRSRYLSTYERRQDSYRRTEHSRVPRSRPKSRLHHSPSSPVRSDRTHLGTNLHSTGGKSLVTVRKHGNQRHRRRCASNERHRRRNPRKT